MRAPTNKTLRRLVASPLLVMGLILAVMAPATAVGLQRYHDVKPSYRFANAINWASDNGITDGCKTAPSPDELAQLTAAEAEMPGFCPDAPVTRAMLMEVLHRYDQQNLGQEGPAGPAGPAGPQGVSGPRGAAAPCPSMDLNQLFGEFVPLSSEVEEPRDKVEPFIVDCHDVETPGQAGCLTMFELGYTLRDAFLFSDFSASSEYRAEYLYEEDLFFGLIIMMASCAEQFGYDDFFLDGGPGLPLEYRR